MLDHLVPLDDLDALAAVRLTGGALGSIQAVPAFPGGHGDIAGGQEVQDILRIALGGWLQVAGLVIGDEHGGGVLGIGLGIADETYWAALNPAGGVEAGDLLAIDIG